MNDTPDDLDPIAVGAGPAGIAAVSEARQAFRRNLQKFEVHSSIREKRGGTAG